VLEHRRLAAQQPSGAEDQQVVGFGQEGHAEDHVETARAQQQVDADAGEYTDRACNAQCHQCIWPLRAERRRSVITPLRALRVREGLMVPIIDRISITPPNTTRYTPVSKPIALASGTSPISGSCHSTWPLVRNGTPNSIEAMPLSTAISRPRPMQRM